MKLSRILMTADSVGGVWTYALELARGLSACGIEVALATMGPRPKPEQRQAAAAIAGLELFESGYKLEWMEEPWDDVTAAGEWLLDLEQRLKPDLIHLNGYAHGKLPWRSPKIVVGHSCVLSWWRAVHGQDAPVEWERYRRVVKAGLQAADLLVAPTNAMLENLDAHYGPLPATAVIANGRRRLAPARLSKEPLILSAGRLWDAAKNVATLESVARELSWPVYVAGEAAATSRHSHLRLLGQLPAPELEGWLDRASIYALPARYEPFGLAVLEAGLAGCALVLGDIPSLREVWGDAAVFVEPGDAETLASVLHELIAHPVWRAALARSAKARAARYPAEAMIENYLIAYERVLPSAQRSENLFKTVQESCADLLHSAAGSPVGGGLHEVAA